MASVARAIALLDALAQSESGLGVNELARRIGVNASTASRLAATLEDAGLVERDGDGGPYRLGLRLVALSDRVLGRLDVRQRARPLLGRLAAQTGETATLSVPSGGEAVTVDFVPSGSSVVSMAYLGRPSILHATAVGKVVLAFDRGWQESGTGGLALPACTERTITSARRCRPSSMRCASVAMPRRSASARPTSARSQRRCSAGAEGCRRSWGCRVRFRGSPPGRVRRCGGRCSMRAPSSSGCWAPDLGV